VEDHIGFDGYTTGNTQSTNHIDSVTGQVLPIDTSTNVANNVVPYTLSDVVLYGTDGSGQLTTFDPFSGATEYNVGAGIGNVGGYAIKMRSDGVLYAYRGIPGDTANNGQLVIIDPSTGQIKQVIGADGIPDFDPNNPSPQQNTSNSIDTFAFTGTP